MGDMKLECKCKVELVCFPGNIIHKAYAYSHDDNPIRVSLVYKFGQRNFFNLY